MKQKIKENELCWNNWEGQKSKRWWLILMACQPACCYLMHISLGIAFISCSSFHFGAVVSEKVTFKRSYCLQTIFKQIFTIHKIGSFEILPEWTWESWQKRDTFPSQALQKEKLHHSIQFGECYTNVTKNRYAYGVTIMVAGNVPGDLSSNPDQGCLHSTERLYPCERHEFNYSPSSSDYKLMTLNLI